MRQRMRYGWQRDLPDHRDKLYFSLIVPPPAVDLRAQCPPVFDQGQIGSCTANALCAAVQFDCQKQGMAKFTASRLFLYYNERKLEHTILTDSGASLRDGCKSLAAQGVCSETIWPYSEAFWAQPTLTCYENAKLTRGRSYARIPQQLSAMQTCLADGYPFVFGISVYESFESDSVTKTGKVPLPGKDETQLGGHALLAVGYDAAQQLFIVQNSWSTTWGDKGYCYLPFAYLANQNLAADFWTIRVIGA